MSPIASGLVPVLTAHLRMHGCTHDVGWTLPAFGGAPVINVNEHPHPYTVDVQSMDDPLHLLVRDILADCPLVHHERADDAEYAAAQDFAWGVKA